MKTTFVFQADNSKFGKELDRVMRHYGITTTDMVSGAQMKRANFCAVWNGKGDFRLSVYVRIVAALREFIPEEEYEGVKLKLALAAF